MHTIYKRIFVLFLCVLLVLSIPLQCLADVPGWSSGSNILTPRPGGAGYKANLPIYRDYGFRITVAEPAQLSGVVETLNGAYTDADLDTQRATIENKLDHMYVAPGNGGIYFWARLNDQISPNLGVSSSWPDSSISIKGSRLTMSRATTVTDHDNQLAWYCYKGLEDEGLPRTAGVPAYDDTMGAALLNTNKTYSDASTYMGYMKLLFMQQLGYGDNVAAFNQNYLIPLMTRVVSNGTGTVENLRKFSWDTNLYGDSGAPASARVLWSRIGHLTMVMQFAWLAQAVGDDATYSEFEKQIGNWITSGFSFDSQPMLEIEACQEVDSTGQVTNSAKNVQLIPMSYMLRTQYGNQAIEALYAGWQDGMDVKTAMLQAIGTGTPVDTGVVGQGFGYYYSGGNIFGPGGASWKDGRAFHTLLAPGSGKDQNFGYVLAFTYAADSTPPPTQNSNAMGSFTWKLDPKGVHDVTPDEEVNASSTVKEINMSQSGYNKNNYSEWESYVNG